MLNETVMFEGLDIDWFTIAAPNVILHFASGGGFVPDEIDSNTFQISNVLLSMPEISPVVIINESLRKFVSIANINDYDTYIKSFVDYAKRGIFSYDKSILNDYGNSLYHLVASPLKALERHQLPEEIRGIIPSTKTFINPPVQLQVDVSVVM